MRWYNSKILRKYFAIFAIYLIISLTFFTARAIAILNYDISGEGDASGFANADGDIIKIAVNASSNVTFIVGQGTPDYQELLLTGCSESDIAVNCLHYFASTDINTNIHNIPFTLKQVSGVPITRSGNLHIDSMAPVITSLNVDKIGTGLNFSYTFTDYLADANEQGCLGSGVGYIAIDVQGNRVFEQKINDTQNCTVSGTYFANLSNVYLEKVRYAVIVGDRAGNEYTTGAVEVNGDFRAPSVAKRFKIMQGDRELTTISSSTDIQADIAVQVEDTNLSTVYADLTNLNYNPAVNMNPQYKNTQATCIRVSASMYNCTFYNIDIRPANGNLDINITATDTGENTITSVSTDVVSVMNDAGKVLYLGPLKSHCTSDLKQCYLRKGPQLIQAELDKTSSYNHSIVYIGVNSEKKFSICKLEDVWRCTGVYNVPDTLDRLNLFIAESYDDYGNMLSSDMENDIIVDNTPPINTTVMTVTNSNNNVNCSVAGDDLTFEVKVKEDSPELKMYLNTSGFTTDKVQNGACTSSDNGEWDCILKVNNFISTAVNPPIKQYVTVEDLAGNKLSLEYNFAVCKGISNVVPNVIFGVNQDTTIIPNIDRRTASKIGVRAYVQLNIDKRASATLMYLNVERCVALGDNGLDVMNGGNYFMPRFGTSPLLVLNIGHEGAQLKNNSMTINCTLSARVKDGGTVFLQDERQDFTVTVNTFNNPMGTIDAATADKENNLKGHLRDIDKELKWRNTVDKILGTICDIGETTAKVNQVMQAIRSVLFVAFYAIGTAYPALHDAMSTAWKFVQKTLGKFHNWTTRFIWPPGMLPGPTQKVSVGLVTKWICTVYTCKIYDIGTLTGLVSEGILTSNNGATQTVNGRTISYDGTKAGGVITLLQDFTIPYQQGYNPETSTYVEAYSRESSNPYFKADMGPGAVDVHINVYTDALSPNDRKAVLDANNNVGDALNNHAWILDPYKSVHYDSLCNPAIIYNLKKDKQITCMYLSCIENQARLGLPEVICDGTYKINKCLYLDSAEYVLAGNSWVRALMQGFVKALASTGLGATIQTVYSKVCRKDYAIGGDKSGMDLYLTAAPSVLCGITGTYFAIKEIADYFGNPFYKFRNADPTDKQNYCAGIDYSEASQVSSDGSSGGYYD